MPSVVILSGRRSVMSSPSKRDRAHRRAVEPGEHVEERRLARAVGPDDRDDRALGDVERDVVDRRQAAEVLGDVVGDEHRRAEAGAGAGRRRSAAGRSLPLLVVHRLLRRRCPRAARSGAGVRAAGPPGRRIITITSRKPKMPKPRSASWKSRSSLPGHAVEHVRDQPVVDERQQDRAEHDAPDRAHAAEDHHREHEDRERERELVGVHRVQVGREEGARDAADRARRPRRRSSFVLTSGTPIDAAAISSSRIATQARPRRESRRRITTNSTRKTIARISQYHGLRFSWVNGSRNGSLTWSTGVMPCRPAVSG